MTIEAASERDGFWARVRTALGRRPAEPAYGQSAIAKSKNRPARMVDEELRRGWTHAGERHVSLCAVALELDGYAEYFAAYGREAVDETLRTLDETIRSVLTRPGDKCVRSGRAGFLLILPDMPVTMARDICGRIAAAVRKCDLPNRQSHAGQVTLSVGLVAVNPQGGFDRGLLGHTAQAVKKAQRRGIGRLEVVDLRGKPEKRKKAA
jgi:diguanylate cyclase (GGDEF)-like protein